jgi:hypothetical protein
MFSGETSALSFVYLLDLRYLLARGTSIQARQIGFRTAAAVMKVESRWNQFALPGFLEDLQLICISPNNRNSEAL